MNNIKITLADRFASMMSTLGMPRARYTPYLISDCTSAEKQKLWEESKELLGDRLVVAPEFENSKALYQFLNQHSESLIYFEDGILSRRIEYIRVLEGAVCSSPDSANLWKVGYEGEESFVFRGSIIIASKLTKAELQRREQLTYILRDSIVI